MNTISLAELYAIILSKIKFIILMSAAFFFVGFFINFFFLTPKYTASSVVMNSISLGQGYKSAKAFSGQGGLQGSISSVLGSGGSSSGESLNLVLEIAKTRDFITKFIDRHNLYPYILAFDSYDKKNEIIYFKRSYNSELNTWKGAYTNKAKMIDEAYRIFKSKHLNIVSDLDMKVGTISLTYYSPVISYDWANKFIADLDMVFREKEKNKAVSNIEYLRTSLSTIRAEGAKMQTSYLLENELQKLMKAEATETFAFEILEPPFLPINKSSMSGLFFSLIFSLIGLILSMFIYVFPSIYKSATGDME